MIPTDVTDEWSLARTALAATRLDGVPRRVLLYGPPGTGKTTAGVLEARSSGQSLVKVTMTDGTPMAELRGHWVPTGDGWTWHHGPMVRAWLDGALLLIDEVDHAPADVHSFLQGLLDDPAVARMMLPSGETVSPAPGFRVVATMNGDPEDLPEALADRFALRVRIGRPHPDALEAISDPVMRAVASDFASMPDPLLRVGLRPFRALSALRAAGVDPEAAAALTLPERRRPDVVAAVEAASLPAADPDAIGHQVRSNGDGSVWLHPETRLSMCCGETWSTCEDCGEGGYCDRCGEGGGCGC